MGLIPKLKANQIKTTDRKLKPLISQSNKTDDNRSRNHPNRSAKASKREEEEEEIETMNG